MAGPISYPDAFDPALPVSEQASFWLFYLDSEAASDADHAAFDAWLAQSEAHGAAYLDAQRLWRALGRLAPEGSVAALAPRRTLLRGRPVALGAALLAACLTIAVLGVGGERLSALFSGAPAVVAQAATYQTAIGEIRSVRLDDDTLVTMSADTEIAVRLERRTRRVDVQRGEALFEVAHDARRPFVVTAGPAEARVLGTVFNVRRGARESVVSVVEGQVGVASALRGDARALRLTAGQQAGVDASGRLGAARGFDVERTLAWRDRRFYFDAAPLSDLAAEINRFSTRPVVIEGAQAGAITVSASFHLDQLPEALQGLGDAFSLTVIERPDRFVVSAPGEE